MNTIYERTESVLQIAGQSIPVVRAATVVVGTGSAGYCAADRLHSFGHRDVIMVTDKVRAGTSRNAGSDKQTYYKLTLSGAEPDSVHEMARTLFDGGSMDGDIALAEAAWSTRAFFHLVEAGVGFPFDGHGQFVGYKTDHDPRQRATSVGPFTSKQMVEALEHRVRGMHHTPVIEGCRVVDLLVHDGRIAGLLAVRLDAGATSDFIVFRCDNLVYATGGPAGIHRDSVYPHGQWGASGAALRAGVIGKNLPEWQFGLASLSPRWNVSGTYMQALPRFVSTDADGGDLREFLWDHLPDYGDQLTRIFLKGYQWPFDIRKAATGSALIDLLVHAETVGKGRRVFLDFTTNPGGRDLDPSLLGAEARDYLRAAGALGDPCSTPAQRLQAMNRPAYEFYLQRGPSRDLETDLLEVGVCAQHNNGGLDIDAWWQSNVRGFFPVGEAAGAHGVYRPGGSALNSGQVGATRAATRIVHGPAPEPLGDEEFRACASPVVTTAVELLRKAGERARTSEDTTEMMLTRAQGLMSEAAGVVRSVDSITEARVRVREWLTSYDDTVVADPTSRRSLSRLFLIRDILATQYVQLSAMRDHLAAGGASRGSVLYTDPSGVLPTLDPTAGAMLPESYRHRLDDGSRDGLIQETRWNGVDEPSSTWREVRPIPDDTQQAFEVVWQGFRENHNVN